MSRIEPEEPLIRAYLEWLWEGSAAGVRATPDSSEEGERESEGGEYAGEVASL